MLQLSHVTYVYTRTLCCEELRHITRNSSARHASASNVLVRIYHVPNGWVMSHMDESCPTWISDATIKHARASIVLVRIYYHVTQGWVMSHMDESCPIWMSHVPHGWGMSHVNKWCHYVVATVSRIDKIIGLFCRMASLLYVSFAKETYNFIDPTNCSHPI